MDKAVLLVNDIDLIENEKARDKVIKFILNLRDNNKNFLIVSNSDPKLKLNLPFTKVIHLELPNEKVRMEILKKYIAHLNQEQLLKLSEELKGKSVRCIINMCNHVSEYWSTHYQGVEKTKPPFKVYMQLVQERSCN